MAKTKLNRMQRYALMTLPLLMAIPANAQNADVIVAQPAGGAGQYYSYVVSPTSTTQNLLFTIRNDPSFTSLADISLSRSGGPNLLTNGNFSAGGFNSGGIIVPNGWFTVGQQGLGAAGTLRQNCGPSGLSCWYDGAVGGRDGIGQTLNNLSVGSNYDLRFWLASSPPNNGSDVLTIVYFQNALPGGFVSTSTPDIDTAVAAYTTTQLLASQVNPNFVGGTLQVAAAGAFANAFTIQAQGGTIDTNGLAATFSGSFSGPGALTKMGTGTLTLTGANSYAGGTALNAGTIAVGNNAALGTGALTMAAGTTLQAGAANLAVGNAIGLTGAASIDVAGQVLTLSGVISGRGPLSVIDSAAAATDALILSGTNSYTGGTTVSGTTLQVAADANMGAAAGGLTLTGATLRSTASFASGRAVTLGTGGGSFNVAPSTILTLNGVVSGTGLTKVNSGTLALNGANSYTGGTALNAGTIAVGNNAALGTGALTMAAGTTLQAGAAGLSVANSIGMAGGGTVDVAGQVLTLAGVISGTGPLAVIDSAAAAGDALILTGANSYTGGTSVSGTTLQVAGDGNLGAAAGGLTLANGTLRTTASFTSARTVSLGAGGGSVDVAPSTSLTLTGVVSGTSLTKANSGELVLNAANSYTGGTALNGGTITVNNNAALGTGTLTTAAGTTLNFGTNALTLANAVSLGGATTVSTGANTATLSGVVSGTGALTKTGSGILNMTGASSYTGATTVSAGTLNVTGALASAVTVQTGAAITGNGTVGALTVQSGGAVSPGGVGTTDTVTLNVTGAGSLAGTYTVHFTPTGNDRITAGGAMTVGGTLAALPTGTYLNFNQVFTVASGSSLTGSFASATGLDQFGVAFAPVLEYTATQANLRLAPQSLVVLGNRFGGISGNQLEVARAFDRAVAVGYNPQAFFNVYANSGTNLPRTLREMSGEQRAAERRVVLDSSRIVRETALDSLNLGVGAAGGQQVSADKGEAKLTYWLRIGGTWGSAKASGAATGFDTQQIALLTGFDWAKDNVKLGGLFSYTTTDVTFSQLGGTSTVETVGGAVYAGWRQPDAGFAINAGFSLASARTSGNRAITLPSFSQTLAGRTTGTTYQVFAELAYDLAKSETLRVEPFVRNSYVTAEMNALAETGGVAALAAPKQTHDINIFNAGLRVATAVKGGKINLHASAAWQRTSGGRDANTFLGIPAVGQFGNIRSVAIDPDALLLQVGASARVTDRVRLGLDYSGLIGDLNNDHSARASLNIAF
ncbi:MAG: autotransporter domain-containing protein [Sphingomonadales bacterium]